jgi:hypothetical protein
VAAVLAVVLAGSAVGYWVPLVRRSSESGLAALGEKVARSGIWITPTMVVARWIELAGNPEMRYATARSRGWWDPMLRSVTRRRREGAPVMQAFLGRVVGALHRAGVPLLAGTDASGWAFMMPGFAIHDEFGLLAASGLSPYEVLRTATVEPARFLQKPDEFGTITPGRRADLVLVEKNPLEDLGTLRKPLGVMARGRWIPAAELEAMVARLAAESP